MPITVDSATSSVETTARRERYRALGQACREHGIRSLLLAHHADDVAETILQRLQAGHNVTGLKGIPFETDIPECHGLYGISQSGEPFNSQVHHRRQVLDIEHGGVKLYRPLLTTRKHELIELCKTMDMPWFEDTTNQDRTLTTRNAIRACISEQRLPSSLRTERLLVLGDAVRERLSSDEEVVTRVYNALSIQLDTRTGRAVVQILAEDVERLKESLHTPEDFRLMNRAASLVRKIVVLVSPQEIVSLQSLEHMTKTILSSLIGDNEAHKSTQASAGQTIARVVSDHDTITVDLHRARPYSSHDHVRPLPVESPATGDTTCNSTWSEWLLFDNRYWIRWRHNGNVGTPGVSYHMTLLTSEMLNAAKAKHKVVQRSAKKKKDTWPSLNRTLRSRAPGQLRYSLPAIVRSSKSQNEIKEDLVALPTLQWSADGLGEVVDDSHCSCQAFEYQIRYKHIEFRTGPKHVLVDL